MTRYFRPFRSEEGATAVEAAIVLSTFLVITLGLIQFAIAYWNYSTMLLAIDEGGRYAMVYNPVNFPNGPPAPCAAQTPVPGCPSPAGTALENCTAAQAQTILTNYRAPNTVKVSAKQIPEFDVKLMKICAIYSFNFIAPGLLPFGPIALKTQVTVPLD
jgi:hypothetical protein